MDHTTLQRWCQRISWRALRHICLALVTIIGAVPGAQSATLTVGAGQEYGSLSDAARAAQPGDLVKIAAGTYSDCAIWTTNNLTIEGTGLGTVLIDKICQEKAIFVISGSDVTVRGITFTRARSRDGNGAGIRAEGTNLTVERSIFLNNEEGILAGGNPQSSLIIRDSVFDHNGSCSNACAHGVYVGNIARLQIERTHFIATQVAHDIKSRALRTILTANFLEDGPDGTSSYKVDLPNGGALVMTNNIIEKGPKNQNHVAAIIIGEEGVSQPTGEIVLARNHFKNDGPPTAFVKNLTATPAVLVGNIFDGQIRPLVGDGTVR